MYDIGQLIVYGGDVCRVDAIGPLEMRGAQPSTDYYTLMPVRGHGKIFTPVDTPVYTRPVLTREEAEALIDELPNLPEEVYENSNPRLLNEHYQTYLKSCDCTRLALLIRAIHAKARRAAQRGRRLGQVDERSFKRAQELLHAELSVALDIPVEEVRAYIAQRIGEEPTLPA